LPDGEKFAEFVHRHTVQQIRSEVITNDPT